MTFGAVLNLLAILVFIGFWLFSFIILYHLIRFGIGTAPKKTSVIFMIGSVALFSLTFTTYLKLDLSNLL